MAAWTLPTLNTYLALITSEHNNQPNFMATVAAEVQPFVDLQATLYAMLGLFTPSNNAAVGDQLDKIGQWVGASRYLAEALPPTGITTLGDSDYRTLLQAIIAQNSWDGTVPGMYTIWSSVFGNSFQVLVQDNQDMTMFVVLLGSTFSVVELALLTNGYFDLRPAGVLMRGYFQPSVPTAPVFGLGIENSSIAGLGVGCWIEPVVV
jgi:hypothetical protein